MNTQYKWNDYNVGYCHQCDCFILTCESCRNSSCSGLGCEDCSGNNCKKWFTLFSDNYNEITKDWIKPPYQKSEEEILLDRIFAK